MVSRADEARAQLVARISVLKRDLLPVVASVEAHEDDVHALGEKRVPFSVAFTFGTSSKPVTGYNTPTSERRVFVDRINLMANSIVKTAVEEKSKAYTLDVQHVEEEGKETFEFSGWVARARS